MALSFRHVAVATDAVRTYDLGISLAPDAPSVTVKVRHAGETNAAYWSAAFKRLNAMGGRARSSAAERKLTPEELTEGRKRSAELFADHVLVGWSNVVEDGKDLAFSPAEARRVLGLLIDPNEGRPDVFDEMRKFCETQSNFTPSAVSADDLGKQ